MKICPNCGAEVSDTAKFCRKCGTPLEAESNIQEDITAAEQAQEQAAEDIVEETVEPAVEHAAEPAAEAEEPAAKETPAFAGDSYEWGPPTGAPEDYNQKPMPPVFVGGADHTQTEESDRPEAYTYREEIPDWDHTAEFDEDDIAENKVVAMAAYLLGPLGVIIALLGGQSSPYAAFHMRQGLKFLIVEALLTIIAVLLCWTLIVPAACGIVEIILAIVKIISFVSVCKGRAEEPAIIRSLAFLR